MVEPPHRFDECVRERSENSLRERERGGGGGGVSLLTAIQTHSFWTASLNKWTIKRLAPNLCIYFVLHAIEVQTVERAKTRIRQSRMHV